MQINSRFTNEDVWNYEAGIKHVLPGHRLQYDASVYYYVYDNRQAIRLDSTTTVPRFVVDTSDLEAWGLEFNASVSYTHLDVYKRQEQTEARLMRTGDLVPLTLVDAAGGREEVAYQVPDENQCAGCHVSDMGTRGFQPIGPKARHLNRDFDYAGADDTVVTANQLAHWQQAGYLKGVPDAAAVPRVADWQDTAATVDARARAYLDINCSHCHSATGSR